MAKKDDVSIIDIDTELNLLQEALKETDELYDEVKTHYDVVKKSASKGTLMFIQSQTSNLISLKSNKVSIIQQTINAKKTKAELELKSRKGDEEDSDVRFKHLAHELYDVIRQNRNDEDVMNKINGRTELPEEAEEEIDYDELIDSRINELEVTEEKSDTETAENDISDTLKIVYEFGSKELFYMDSDDTIHEDVEIPEDKQFKKFIYEGSDVIGAELEDGEIVEVVYFE